MLKFVQRLVAPKPSPIGVSLGTESLRLAQVQRIGGEWHLLAATEVEVPVAARRDLASRLTFFEDTVKTILSRGEFKGHQAVLGMPAAMMCAQHLRLPKMDLESLRKALPWELRGKMPIDPAHAMMRHIVAGEVYQDKEPSLEVVVMAAPKDSIQKCVKAAERAKLDVVGMESDPLAIVHCIAPAFWRKDADPVIGIVDIGAEGTRLVLVQGENVLFARFIAIGGEKIAKAVAVSLGISEEQAQAMQRASTVFRAADVGGEEAGGSARAVAVATADAGRGEVPGHAALERLVEELELCRRYHDAAFPNRPIERLVFVGGGARQRVWCQYVARRLNIAAQVGDALAQIAKPADQLTVGPVDMRQPQPAWAVAVGLSLGKPVRS